MRAVKKTGYAPNPQVARLMSIVRSAKSKRVRAVIGVVRDDIPEDELHDPAYHTFPITIFARAPSSTAMPSRSFSSAVMAHADPAQWHFARAGHRGVDRSPHRRASSARSSTLPLRRGDLWLRPAIPRPAPREHQHDAGHFDGGREAARAGLCTHRLAVTHWIDARSDHTYSGAMLHYQQQIPPKQRVPSFFFPTIRRTAPALFAHG